MQADQCLVAYVMLPLDRIPVTSPDTLLKECLEMMVHHHIGASCIVDRSNHLLGVFTDGDLRRIVLSVQKPMSALLVDDVINYATQNPIVISPMTTLSKAIALMGEKKVWDIPVVNKYRQLEGLLHLHPAIKSLTSSFDPL